MDNKFVYLALGGNLGNRSENFINSVKKLEENGVKFIVSSPIYRTPALLLKGSPDEWNIPFLNAIIKVDTSHSPYELLNICKKIEHELGRDFSQKWSPRPIDIDILYYKGKRVDTENLTIPHKAIFDRYFLLDELSFIFPEIVNNKNYYGGEHQPIFMGILNITPDSFSDGGIYNVEKEFIETFETWEKEFVGIIDIGAESTRPGANLLTPQEEIERLNFVFKYLKNKKFSYFKPILSIDTYHYETAKTAVANGFNIINDVSGLVDERMLDIIKDNDINYVLTHSLSVPPKKDLVIKNIQDIHIWLEEKLNLFEKKNIKKEQIFFDIGIGFGKTPFQSLQLLQNIEKFQKYGIKLLVGHSRKGFMKIFNNDIKTSDAETLAISLGLANRVDMIRTHTPIEHQNALLANRSLDNNIVIT